ncbi:hypothetical protein, partial [uncultured Megasphaera sp.]|uniref:hypothetical protein n=1 Tax=uncultured Megasphaera sp. TaxID=165188 RepID=UPI00267166E2
IVSQTARRLNPPIYFPLTLLQRFGDLVARGSWLVKKRCLCDSAFLGLQLAVCSEWFTSH